MKNRNTSQHRIPRANRLAPCIAALGMTFAVVLPSMAHTETIAPPPVPANLQVKEGNDAFLVGHALGTQNYVCVPTPTIGQVAWSLFTPEATLFDDDGEQIITHFFGPNPVENRIVRAAWQDSRDTSTVWGRATASSTDPNFVMPGAIAWLLVEAVGTQDGPTGGDNLSKTTFIQRVNTVGGAAPSRDCVLPTDIGHRAFVPYTADYFFYRKSE